MDGDDHHVLFHDAVALGYLCRRGRRRARQKKTSPRQVLASRDQFSVRSTIGPDASKGLRPTCPGRTESGCLATKPRFQAAWASHFARGAQSDKANDLCTYPFPPRGEIPRQAGDQDQRPRLPLHPRSSSQAWCVRSSLQQSLSLHWPGRPARPTTN